MKKLNLFVLMALLILPVFVNAASFKNGDTLYVFEERKIECIPEDAYPIGMDDENNLVYDAYDSNTSTSNFYRVNAKNECTKITEEEAMAIFDNYIYEDYSIAEVDGKYVIKRYIEYYDGYGFVKTKDTDIVENKKYFTFDGYVRTEVAEPKKEDLSLYYDEIYLESAEGTTFDSNKTYYVYNSSNASIIDVVVDAKKEDIDTYFFEMEKPYDEKFFDVLNQEKIKELKNNNEYLYDGVYHLSGDKFLIYFAKNNDANSENPYLMDFYDVNGNKIEAFQNVAGMSLLNDTLFVAGTEDSFVIYNEKYEKIYENKIENLSSLSEIKYDNHIHYLRGFVNNSQNQRIYHLYEYKVVEGENQTFTDGNLKVKFSGLLEKLTRVLVNDVELDEKYYTLESGSTIVTLKKEYLDTLESGAYTLKVEYNDGGSSEAVFNVTNTTKTPNTGDSIYLYTVLLVVSMSSLVLVKKYLKKN